MKAKILFMAFALLVSGATFSQKKKAPVAKKPQTVQTKQPVATKPAVQNKQPVQDKPTVQNKPSAQTNKQSNASFYGTPYALRNSGSFDRDTHLVNITYGFPNLLDYTGYFYNSDKSGIGPLTVRYEFPVRDEVGVGLSISGAIKKWEFADNYSTKIIGISISPLGFYHFNKLIAVRKLDLYAGVGASIDLRNYKYETANGNSDDSDLEVNPAGMVGARYYFTDSFSGMAEVGEGSYSNFRIGVSFRL